MHGAQFIWPLVVLTLSGVLLLISLFLFRLKKHLIEKEVELRNLIIKMHQAQSELNEYKNMVDEEILRDSVTGLSSFTVFKEHMQQVLEQSAARRMVFGLLLLDIRNFSIINSTLGYHMGDLVLKEVANKLQACIRQTDGACRFSGDIFIILLSKLNHADSAILIVQRIFQKLAEPFVVNGHSLALQANIGIVTYPADGHNVDTLLQKAANALSQAKAIGAQHFQFYQDEMQNQSQRELVLNSALALDSVFNEFSIEYQPQFDTKKDKVFCWEAILRWDHPELGAISSQELVRLAEKNSKLEVISEWMLSHICSQMQAWQSKGHSIFVSINISPYLLESPHFVSIILRILKDTQVDASSLYFEVAESDIISHSGNAEKALSVLKQLGSKIAVDHFGAGDFLLRQLKTLPVDCVKIDSNFIRDIATSKETEAIVKMMLALANTLDKCVVALGVETEAQKQILQKLGCHLMQGKLFSDPIKESEVEPKLISDSGKSVHQQDLTVS